jgi:hypothetical protein
LKRHEKKPNFFLVGAPKCATTAMAGFLGQHPDIFIPEMKEPHYFGSDLSFRRNFVRGPEWFRPTKEHYLDMYAPVTQEKMLGDASVLYLYSREAPRELKLFCPDAKIIIMIRNPIEMVYSLHSHWLYNLNEDIADFETALEAEPERKKGHAIPSNAYWIDGLIYSQVGLFSKHINRYLSEFGTENVHIIVHDDMKSDMGAEFHKLMQFLAVDDEFKPNLSQVNTHKEIRSKRLQSLIINPPDILQMVATPLIQVPQIRKLLKLAATGINVAKKRRRPMTAQAAQKLRGYYAEEIDTLSLVLNRDLTHWGKTVYE